ncbi:hypothetical protein [Caballeronia sp. J97]|uniref:hypothetical protein n=1 Tax=Caballeronia sp. J97 TaxID=2805429 RepID=UPI002AB156DA|nr:hypothetical protein [Caballeronia sp. J97]
MRRDELLKRLADITPDQLAAYLNLRGWRKDADLGEIASVWHRPEAEQEDAEVLLPSLRQRARDFASRLVDAVLSIADFEGRAVADIVADVVGHFADRIRVRVFHFDVEGGTIPLDDGVLLNERVRDLIEAAAFASTSKRSQYTGRKPDETLEYLRSLRLGQTEVGSYVVNVIAPLPLQDTTQLVLPLIPARNIVTATLASGLYALDEAIDKIAAGGRKHALDEAVRNGASANLCDALVGLSGTDKKRGFEVVIASAGSGSVPTPPARFVFDPDKVERVAEAAMYYKREDFTLYDRTITGSVERLDRPSANDTGIVTVNASVDGQARNIAVALGKEEYQQAVLAHFNKHLVRCHGDVRITARAARLVDPRGFRVINNDELL